MELDPNSNFDENIEELIARHQQWLERVQPEIQARIYKLEHSIPPVIVAYHADGTVTIERIGDVEK